MKVTQHYTENWERTNKWLLENAPDYVIECVEETGHHFLDCQRKYLELSNAADKYVVKTELLIKLQKEELFRRRPLLVRCIDFVKRLTR